MPSPRIAAATILLCLAALPGRAAESARPPGPAVEVLPQASLLAGHFHLASPDGRTVDSDDLAGKPYGVVFGFTQCPDICPTTLSTLTTALASLPKADLTIYFVSVDPERDGPETLARYITSFDPRIVALTGPGSAVEEAIASFGAVARRTPLPGGGYAFSHTASILLVDGDGVMVDRIGTEAGPDRLADRLAALAGAGARRTEAPSR